MGSFKRALLGYRRDEVDAAIAARDARAMALERDAENALERWREASESTAELEREVSSLAEMVIEREREIRGLADRLREANERHDRSIVSLESVSARLEEIHAQARGQATRIRMKALHDAVEVSRRAQDLAEVEAGASQEAPVIAAGVDAAAKDLFEGPVKVEIGPLGDFSQLVGFEDAIGQLGASEISVERFSEGRATLSMRLEEPVELLRELEERSPLEFQVRRTADDNLILDIDEDQGPEQHAA
jgi:DNA repair exonuclease SbcCD ATPase subunit